VTSLLREALPADPAAVPGPRRTGPRILLAVVSGLLLCAAFPPVHLWWTAPIGVAGLTLAVRGASWRLTALLGQLCGLAFFLPLLQWSSNVVGVLAWLAERAGERKRKGGKERR